MCETKKPMPDWMMRYVSNINTDECYRKFRELSKEYYEKLGIPNSEGEKKSKLATNLDMFNANRVINNHTPIDFLPDTPNFEITERYKERSRYLAHAMGYGEIKPMENWHENNPSVDDVRKNTSREDKIADILHKEFGDKQPDKAARSKSNETLYRNKEDLEFHADSKKTKNTKGFERTQDKFEAERVNAKQKGDNSFSKLTVDEDPDPNDKGRSSKSSGFEDNSTDKKCRDFLDNSLEISSNKMLKSYFESRGMTQEILDNLTSKESGFSEKKATKDKDDVENQTKTETEKSSMVDVYFKKHGIIINKDGNESPTFGKTISNDNFSITYTKQDSRSDYKKKSRNMDKE